jgi:hypothetical protein
MEIRSCKICKIKKELQFYHVSKRHPLGRKMECADCTNEYLRNHYHTKTKIKEDFRLIRIDKYYKRKYNISYESYLKMCENNQNKCSICSNVKIPAGASCKGSKDVLVLDHCHDTGKIRGILCQECNQGLGLFKDNINNLVMAHLYLLQTETDKSEDAKEGL